MFLLKIGSFVPAEEEIHLVLPWEWDNLNFYSGHSLQLVMKHKLLSHNINKLWPVVAIFRLKWVMDVRVIFEHFCGTVEKHFWGTVEKHFWGTAEKYFWGTLKKHFWGTVEKHF